jgi:catechol 2,3-dioxygenase-like lactoylglutathione lyase family enzyme
VIRSVTLSVPDLERSRRFFVDALGLDETEAPALHGPEHERLWGLEGASRRSLELWAGDFLVELVEYLEPRGRPRPLDYRISDQGLMNVALGFRDRAELRRTYARCVAGRHRGNWRPVELGVFNVVYVNDGDGFSVELLRCPRWAEPLVGFRPVRGAAASAAQGGGGALGAQPLAPPSGRYRAQAAVTIAAPRESVWKRLREHDRLPMPWPASGMRVVWPGVDERNGLGAVREVRLPGGLDFEERIVGWDAPRAYDYVVTRGAPLRDHRGRIELDSAEGRGSTFRVVLPVEREAG